jgi:hypothetical protein
LEALIKLIPIQARLFLPELLQAPFFGHPGFILSARAGLTDDELAAMYGFFSFLISKSYQEKVRVKRRGIWLKEGGVQLKGEGTQGGCNHPGLYCR